MPAFGGRSTAFFGNPLTSFPRLAPDLGILLTAGIRNLDFGSLFEAGVLFFGISSGRVDETGAFCRSLAEVVPFGPLASGDEPSFDCLAASLLAGFCLPFVVPRTEADVATAGELAGVGVTISCDWAAGSP